MTLQKITFNGQEFGVALVADTNYVSEKITKTASTETVLSTLVNLILSVLNEFFGVEYDIFSVTANATLREHRLSWTKRLSLSLATCWRWPDGFLKVHKGSKYHVRHFRGIRFWVYNRGNNALHTFHLFPVIRTRYTWVCYNRRRQNNYTFCLSVFCPTKHSQLVPSTSFHAGRAA